MIRHNYGLKEIGIGLGLIAALLLLTACQEEKEIVVLDEIVVTPEQPIDEDKYTEDGRKLPALKKKYQ